MVSSEKVSFTGAVGHALSGKMDLPDSSPKAYGIFAHHFVGSKDVLASSRVSTYLAEHGYGMLRFDFTGLGQSKGDFADTSFSTNVDDLMVASQWMADRGQQPSFLVGHSLGGAAVLAAGGKLDNIQAVATIGAPASVNHVVHHFEKHIDDICEMGQAEVQLGGQRLTLSRAFIEDVHFYDVLKTVHDCKRALMIMHSPLDQTVSIDNARQIFEVAKHPKSFIGLPGADHLLTKRADAAYVADVIAAWVQAYISVSPEGH